MQIAQWLLAVLTLLRLGEPALAESAKTLRAQLIASWTFVLAEVTAADCSRSLPSGQTPGRICIFTPHGHFAQIHVPSDAPKIASNNRLTGTPEEYKAINQRSLSVFGTYTVDEGKKTVTYQITASTFPNWEGVSQTRNIETLTAEEFRNTKSGR